MPPAALIRLFGLDIDLRPTTAAKLRELVDSFGEAAEPATPAVHDSFGGSLAPVGGDASGGKFAVWRDGPVIYFGTEGQVHVAAPDLEGWNACKDEAAVRALSPDECYEAGELIRYEWRYSWGSGTSRGIVLANPAPDRVLIGSQHNTFVRACARAR